MTTPAETLPDLPESERGRNEAVLLAGSAGYLYFLQQLVPFISPPEAKETYHRFRFASRIFWLTIIAFLAMYVTVNQSLGPYSLRAVSCVNDLLRAALFVWSVMLVRRYRISIAAQLLLPIASLCFLPFAPKSEPVWIYQPLIFGAIVLALAAIGWCIDGPSLGQLDRAEIFPRVCLALAMVLWKSLI